MANMFVDQIKIEAHAGKGGNGMVAFGAKSTFPTVVQPVAMVVAAAALF